MQAINTVVHVCTAELCHRVACCVMYYSVASSTCAGAVIVILFAILLVFEFRLDFVARVNGLPGLMFLVCHIWA